MSAVRPLQTAPQLHVDYVAQSDAASIDAQLARPDTLAVIGFGDAMPAHADPRCLRVPLQAFGPAPLEVWRARGPVSYGMDGGVRWAQDDALHFGAIEIPEAAGGLEAASAEAYATLSAFVAARGFPSLLRSWNYLDAITEGDDDDERYRRFCIGRAAGWATSPSARCPRPPRSVAETARARCRCTGWRRARPARRSRIRAR